MSSTRNITHLQLSESERQLANVRAAMLRLTLSEYIGHLVRTDARLSGLIDLVEAERDKEVGHE